MGQTGQQGWINRLWLLGPGAKMSFGYQSSPYSESQLNFLILNPEP